jgi:hypothetical protein
MDEGTILDMTLVDSILTSPTEQSQARKFGAMCHHFQGRILKIT